VLEAAARCGVQKVIFTSSESTLGFAFMTNFVAPRYFPIDEKHPIQAQDPYSLSKILGEQICKTYSLRYGMQTICLREPWIWVPEPNEIALYRELVAHPEQWYKNLWAYVHVFDVAQAFRLALEAQLMTSHEIFFITADDNWTGHDSRTLIAKHYPMVIDIVETMTNDDSLISSAKAKRLLGYQPHYSWKDILQ
jgi:nucleoside-diphosphate-sugar epimerase